MAKFLNFSTGPGLIGAPALLYVYEIPCSSSDHNSRAKNTTGAKLRILTKNKSNSVNGATAIRPCNTFSQSFLGERKDARGERGGIQYQPTMRLLRPLADEVHKARNLHVKIYRSERTAFTDPSYRAAIWIYDWRSASETAPRLGWAGCSARLPDSG
jgi:hypothetical protein